MDGRDLLKLSEFMTQLESSIEYSQGLRNLSGGFAIVELYELEESNGRFKVEAGVQDETGSNIDTWYIDFKFPDKPRLRNMTYDEFASSLKDN